MTATSTVSIDDEPCECDVQRELTIDREFEVAPEAGGGWGAWAVALARLVERVADGPTHCLLITQQPNERYVQLLLGHGQVHLETSSNVYLEGDFRLSSDEEGLLRGLGFGDPDSAADGMPENWWMEQPFTSGHALAELVTTVTVTVAAFDARYPLTVTMFGADHPCAACAWFQ